MSSVHFPVILSPARAAAAIAEKPPHRFLELHDRFADGLNDYIGAINFPKNDFIFAGERKEPSAILSTSRASNGSYTKQSGEIVTFGTNEPRYGDKGLLVEEARTNLIQHSENISFSPWITVNGVTFSVDNGIAPDGTQTADRVIKGATAFAAVNQIFTASLTPYTASIYLKKGTNTKGTILITGDNAGAAGFGRVEYDLDAGTAIETGGSTNVLSFSMKAVANGFYRCIVTYNMPATSSPRIYLYPGVYNGTSAGYIYAWGAQVEAGRFPTSYIKTTSSTALRAADIVSIDLSPYIAATPVSIMTQTNVPYAVPTGANAFIYGITNGTINEEIAGYVSASAGIPNIVNDGGVTQGNVFSAGGAITHGTTFKQAFAAATNDMRAALNGASIGTPDTVCTMPDIDQLRLGARVANYFYLNGYIEALALFDRALSDVELQTITEL